MKKYIVEISETAEQDLENVAGSMSILDEKLTGHKNIRKINVRNYIVFYIVDEENSKVLVVSFYGLGKIFKR